MKSKLAKFLRSAWEYAKKAKLELIVLFAFILIDLLSKSIVDWTMELGESVTLIPKFLHITYSHNDAAAFGSSFGLDKLLGKTGTIIFFIVIAVVAICFFSYFMYKNQGSKKIVRIAYALIIAGATGNLVDRILYQYVRDFIQFEYLGLTIFGSTTFAIFNIADAALTIGVIMFAIYYIFIYKEPQKEVESAEQAEIATETVEKNQEKPEEVETKNVDANAEKGDEQNA